MTHKLVQEYMTVFDLTEKQATYLMAISRFGFSTSKILQIISIGDGVKNMQGVYTRLKQLKKKKLIKTMDVFSIPGVDKIILPTDKVRQASQKIKYNCPPSPKSAVQLRHNAIAIAVVFMELDLNSNIDAYLTTNQTNYLKFKDLWKSKVPDAVCIDTSTSMGYLIEVELNIKPYKAYEKAFSQIFTEDKVGPIKNGWGENLYYVDSQRDKVKMQNRINKVIKEGNSTIVETAQNTVVRTLDELLIRFNRKNGTDIKMEMFRSVL